MKTLTKSGDHAAVIGGSIAGLLAARVLSDHFGRVTVVERDKLPNRPVDRKGVPHGRHLHALLVRGEQILNELFPGLSADLEDAGALRLNAGRDLLWVHDGACNDRFEGEMTVLTLSRGLLEALVRERVRGLANVTFLDETAVEGLMASSDRSRVTGLVVTRPAGGATAQLEADFVVDATGRGSRAPRWLEAMGYERPTETEVKVGLHYATRIYRRDPSLLHDAEAIFIQPEPPLGKRSGVMFPIEDGRWMVTLAGWLGERAPSDEEGFLRYARSLPNDALFEVLARAKPVGEVVTHSFPATVRRHYELLRRFPERYLVIGDAICSFNPVYGQGMSVAALEAEALDQELAAGIDGIGRRFFRASTRAIATPWMIAVGADFRFDGVQGRRAPLAGLVNWYLTRVTRTALHDREAALAFSSVLHLLRAPGSLFSPRLALRVLRASLADRGRVASRDESNSAPARIRREA